MLTIAINLTPYEGISINLCKQSKYCKFIKSSGCLFDINYLNVNCAIRKEKLTLVIEICSNKIYKRHMIRDYNSYDHAITNIFYFNFSSKLIEPIRKIN